MAERLAPDHAPPRTDSRPERPRGRLGRVARRILVGWIVLSLLLVGAVFTAHFVALPRSADDIRPTALIPEGMPASALVVVARPGQEVTMAGTLAALGDSGVRVSVLSLTKGEAQGPVMDAGAERIGGIRADELAAVGDILGAEAVTVGDAPDGGVIAADPAAVTATITSAIAAAAPSVILTVDDLTGRDSDSQATASYVLRAAEADGSGVARVWTVTRSAREVQWNDLWADPIAQQAPPADVMIRIDDQAQAKGRVLSAHGTQSPDLGRATYPLADRAPAWAYFRFWDREYFALAWGEPLA